MKAAVLGAVAVSIVAISSPASAQLGGLINKAQRVADEAKKVDALNISEAEELRIGSDVSQKVRTRFGVVQDAAVHKYVTLVGMALAQQTERPGLPWTFIVLDTDGVNAFASPGGFVHITRGALGLIRSEGELAAVLAHEIGHVAHKHTVNAIRKANAEKMASQAALADRSAFLSTYANYAYDMVLEGKFDRGDELDADASSVAITSKLGYAPASLAEFLARLDDRNKNEPARNGLFASHPETKERIEKIRQLAAGKSGAIVQPRYAANVKYQAAPLTTIAVVTEGSAGLAGSTAPKGDAKKDEAGKDDKKEEPKKAGFGLGSLKKSASPEQSSAQVSASGGARGVGPDRLAKGGDNPAIVKVAVTAAEIAEFKKGIA